MVHCTYRSTHVRTIIMFCHSFLIGKGQPRYHWYHGSVRWEPRVGTMVVYRYGRDTSTYTCINQYYGTMAHMYVRTYSIHVCCDITLPSGVVRTTMVEYHGRERTILVPWHGTMVWYTLTYHGTYVMVRTYVSMAYAHAYVQV
jgi:hypothetical protein